MGSLNLPNEIDKDEIRQQYQAAMTLLNDVIAAWPTMTGTQKQTWLANNMDVVLKTQRAMLVLFGKMLA